MLEDEDEFFVRVDTVPDGIYMIGVAQPDIKVDGGERNNRAPSSALHFSLFAARAHPLVHVCFVNSMCLITPQAIGVPASTTSILQCRVILP